LLQRDRLSLAAKRVLLQTLCGALLRRGGPAERGTASNIAAPPALVLDMPQDGTNPERIELVIFDCDGVLIDSEIVVCRLTSEELTRLGYSITTSEVIERYAGRPEHEMIADIERDWGRTVPAEYFGRIRQCIDQAYSTELRAMPGAADVLGRIRVPICVASSSYPEKLKLGLETVGLHERFAPNLVSASFVAHGKPAPDVFIYAAGWMRTPVPNCLVIEDSIFGVRAARGAGMRVFGFTGGGHCSPDHGRHLMDAGAERVIADFRELDPQLPAVFRG
jgi:HAD superfamily hydrolase (TIGR01509 family)